MTIEINAMCNVIVICSLHAYIVAHIPHIRVLVVDVVAVVLVVLATRVPPGNAPLLDAAHARPMLHVGVPRGGLHVAINIIIFVTIWPHRMTSNYIHSNVATGTWRASCICCPRPPTNRSAAAASRRRRPPGRCASTQWPVCDSLPPSRRWRNM